MGKHLMFKTKEEKHSVTKVKTIAAPDVEKMANIAEFVERTVTSARFSQAITSVFSEASLIDVRQLGDVIKWVQQDILKEEADTLEASGFAWKDVTGPLANATKKMFFAAMSKL